ncbi:nicotinate-nucleotide--dimethylbenzimidazole phosphoribosyltransferase [Gudongella oleilytica]|uniref:nicotinate-nucleotide--dimethylbenzimidazole phosphoribosyltransferase n=1 Tax=Gudongella oleilytica TaxID=1582259 RepID=UPI002A360A57|nr:nicotinate-nucleotide--dimethylbenzimidazole phosphoribosyltransferase [Gudongella oleilytica]MDY0258023.1 nicotinate-nucleotide--dimethylbenzimidazole phosphoribosyltransferase [Gudongella oleilytica]
MKSFRDESSGDDGKVRAIIVLWPGLYFFTKNGGIVMNKEFNIKGRSEKELEQALNEIVENIQELDRDSAKIMKKRLDAKIKPIKSLGVLEDIAIQLAGVHRNPYPKITGKAVLLMAGDHGVVKEGVSAAPQEVTAQLFYSYLSGGGGINVLTEYAGAKVICTDLAIASPLDPPELMDYRIKNGADNIAEGPAMTRKETLQALLTGAKIASEAIESGINVLAAGEVGIGNTTPSAALISILTGCSVEEATGSGTGLRNEALLNKHEVIKKAIKLNDPDANDPIDVLSKVGGVEIAAMVGAILGAARSNVPTILDGIISSAAALIAAKLNSTTIEYMITSHSSEEKGELVALKHLGLEPRLFMNMRLGEGTGAALMFPIIEAALKLADDMATFETAGVTTGDF